VVAGNNNRLSLTGDLQSPTEFSPKSTDFHSDKYNLPKFLNNRVSSQSLLKTARSRHSNQGSDDMSLSGISEEASKNGTAESSIVLESPMEVATIQVPAPPRKPKMLLVEV
jgi:hypothetical protein